MASRPVWEGHLRLSLVTCPVALHKATQEGRGAVRFHLLNPATHNRVKQAWKDAAEGTELDRRELVRGYEVEKDSYVVVEDAELEALKPESTKVIDIERFVAARAIDRLYWDQPYYLVPDGKPAAEPYAVIREAMQKEGQVALGRLVMASRERVVAIEVRAEGMLLTTLRSHDEVRDAAALFDAIPEVRISPRMVEIAKQIIAQAEGAFDPSEFRDRYEAALRELLERKAAGAKPVRRPEAPPEASNVIDLNVIDLMDALRRSLKSGGGGGVAAGRGRAANDDPRAEAAPRTAAAGRKPHRASSRGEDEGGDAEAAAAPARLRPRRRRQGGAGARPAARRRG
jgi:DNA end-binding protein Ku